MSGMKIHPLLDHKIPLQVQLVYVTGSKNCYGQIRKGMGTALKNFQGNFQKKGEKMNDGQTVGDENRLYNVMINCKITIMKHSETIKENLIKTETQLG